MRLVGFVFRFGLRMFALLFGFLFGISIVWLGLFVFDSGVLCLFWRNVVELFWVLYFAGLDSYVPLGFGVGVGLI